MKAKGSPLAVKQVKQKQFTFAVRRSCQGVKALELFVPAVPMPVACVWHRRVGNHTIEILNSVVCEPFRRLGLRTACHYYLASYKSVNRIISAAATESGAAWMRAVGYQAEGSDWVFAVTDEVRDEAVKWWDSVMAE